MERQTFRLRADIRAMRMKRKDDGSEFVSTRCSDNNGGVHSLAMSTAAWDCLAGSGLGALDKYTFSGVLELPEKGSAEEDAATVVRSNGTCYVSGSVKDAELTPDGLPARMWGSPLPKAADLPEYKPVAKAPSLAV